MELQLKHLAPYLAYGLELYLPIDEIKIGVLEFITDREYFTNMPHDLINIKPILRPLSDLTKEIEVDGEKFKDFASLLESITKTKWVYFKDEEELHNLTYSQDNNGNQYDSGLDLPYYIVQKLFEWHFDVYGLIEAGLAIDMNSLNLK